MISNPRQPRRALLLVAVVYLAACGGDNPTGSSGNGNGSGNGSGSGNGVSVQDNSFSPSSRTISTGTTVTWTWIAGTNAYTGTEPNSHSVTFNDGVGSSGVQSVGTHTRQFTQTGTFDYFCSVHGASIMAGVITVE